jgi:hypothetical protein
MHTDKRTVCLAAPVGPLGGCPGHPGKGSRAVSGASLMALELPHSLDTRCALFWIDRIEPPLVFFSIIDVCDWKQSMRPVVHVVDHNVDLNPHVRSVPTGVVGNRKMSVHTFARI